MKSERRTASRHGSGLLRARLRKRGFLAGLTGAASCEVVDFNLIGLGLITGSSLGPGTRVIVELELAGKDPIRVSGVVRHANPADYDHYRLGVEFDEFSETAEMNTPNVRKALFDIEAYMETTESIESGSPFPH